MNWNYDVDKRRQYYHLDSSYHSPKLLHRATNENNKEEVTLNECLNQIGCILR